MNRRESLKIAIDAHVRPGRGGGVSQAVAGIIRTLGMLEGEETYVIVVESQDQRDWLQPISGPNQRFAINVRQQSGSNRGLFRAIRRPIAKARRLMIGTTPSRNWPEVPISDGSYERLECDLIHFPTQRFVVCALPSIYNPHDLQHLHWPQFFTPKAIAERETVYRTACDFARTVVVGSQWVKDDVVNQYRIDPVKVQVVPEHPATEFASQISPEYISEIREKYALRQPFAVYPAVTWPHKNHIRLLEALAYLRDERGRTINLICTGGRCEPHWPAIEECLDRLKLRDQVRFLGFVSEHELKAIYRLSQFLVMPSLFEASSLPIFEAWLEGTPVASSDVTALPDQVMDAGLLFDATDTKSIADAILRMASDEALREQLRSRAYRRLRDFNSERTAKAYRAIYRRTAGSHLTDEDRWLLSWDWMRHPDRKMEVA